MKTDDCQHRNAGYMYRRRIRRGLLFALCCLLSSVMSCQSYHWQGFPQSHDPGYVWPSPPEAARLGFVMDLRQHRQLYRESGFWHNLATLISGPRDSRLVRPYALALHPSGLLVTDPGRQGVHFYDWLHGQYFLLGETLEGGLPSPVGVGVLQDGRILVSDSRLAKVMVFSADGESLGRFGPEGCFERPAGIAVHPVTGEVFVTDVTTHRIAVLDSQGQLQHWFGGRGAGEGKFNFPTHLAFAPDGTLAVTDSMNFQVQLLKPDGTFIRAIGEMGQAPGQFAKPKGVAFDAQGHLFVIEGLYDTLQVFSSEGDLLLNLGTPGSEPGQFWLPAGLCVDWDTGLLFVADSYNSRVQIMRRLTTSAEN